MFRFLLLRDVAQGLLIKVNIIFLCKISLHCPDFVLHSNWQQFCLTRSFALVFQSMFDEISVFVLHSIRLVFFLLLTWSRFLSESRLNFFANVSFSVVEKIQRKFSSPLYERVTKVSPLTRSARLEETREDIAVALYKDRKKKRKKEEGERTIDRGEAGHFFVFLL